MNLIVAVDSEWGIGRNNELLFHLPEDMKFFRATTIGHNVICGKNTLMSFPGSKPLPKRRHFVLTHGELPQNEQLIVVRDLHDLEEKMKSFSDECFFVIGSASVYRQLYQKCKKAFVTKIHSHAVADTFFPNLDEDPDFRLAEDSGVLKSENGLEYSFCIYENLRLR